MKILLYVISLGLLRRITLHTSYKYWMTFSSCLGEKAGDDGNCNSVLENPKIFDLIFRLSSLFYVLWYLQIRILRNNWEESWILWRAVSSTSVSFVETGNGSYVRASLSLALRLAGLAKVCQISRRNHMAEPGPWQNSTGEKESEVLSILPLFSFYNPQKPFQTNLWLP